VLDKLIPQNSALRQQLRLVSRYANFAVTPRLRRNFTVPTEQGIAELRRLLETVYFPSWFAGAEMGAFLSSPEGREAFRNHLFYRLEMDRYELVPWIDSVLPLRGARILEVGCGTGSGTVALAEQGAQVTALDVHTEALLVADLRCRIHGLGGVDFVQMNAEQLTTKYRSGQFDLILFFAVLEHMTLAEREVALRSAWTLLNEGGYLCVTETPNRLWPYDAHTSLLPFFNWLPDELAFRYAQHSPRPSLRSRFGALNEETMLRFRREGRGMSFHELDLALGGNYRVESDRVAFLAARNPIKLLKRFLARDGAGERRLNAYAPHRPRPLFRQNLDLVIRKVADDSSGVLAVGAER
jgi:2-polyprenyl-3-methyl-5-hydroxy-6-metoxy-1,4-benzoquinol methylase